MTEYLIDLTPFVQVLVVCVALGAVLGLIQIVANAVEYHHRTRAR